MQQPHWSDDAVDLTHLDLIRVRISALTGRQVQRAVTEAWEIVQLEKLAAPPTAAAARSSGKLIFLSNPPAPEARSLKKSIHGTH